MSKKRIYKSGFTLIELLVVISIIAVLMSIMMPALTKVRRQSRKVLCSNNIRQMLVGMNSYASAHDGKYPERANDAAPYKLWWRNDETSVLNMMLNYTLSNSETSDLAFCPLRDKKTWAGGINPGIAEGYNPSEIERNIYGNFLYVKNTGYFIGYSMFGGITGYRNVSYYDWKESGNTERNRAPRVAGAGNDVLVTDFVQVREGNWYASHTKNPTYESPMGLYRWSSPRRTVLQTPAEFEDMNVGYGDGHVEAKKEFTNYVETINSSDKRWYLY